MQKSAIWRHFTEVDSEKKVTCLHCPQQLSVANKSTCSLIRHMTKKHPEVMIRRHSNPEARGTQEVLLLNNDTDGNSDSPDDPILEYEIEEKYDSENDEDKNEHDQKPLKIFRSKTKCNQKHVDQQVVAAVSEAKKQIGEVLSCMKTLKRESSDEDEFDHFGHVIASKLRKIQNMEQREIVMHSVYNVVYEGLMKNV